MQTPYFISLFRSNCVPKALWLVSGKPEICVLGLCFSRGFNSTKSGGMFTYEWLYVAKKLGLNLIRVDTSTQGEVRYNQRSSRYEMTLGEFCRQYKVGVYLVQTWGHLLVVNNGVVVDLNYGGAHARRYVRDAWVVENAALKPLRPKGKRLRNPLFTFVRLPWDAHPHRRYGTPSRIADTYDEAFKYVGKGRVGLLSDVLANTKYIRRDFDWDVKHGNIEIVEEE